MPFRNFNGVLEKNPKNFATIHPGHFNWTSQLATLSFRAGNESGTCKGLKIKPNLVRSQPQPEIRLQMKIFNWNHTAGRLLGGQPGREYWNTQWEEGVLDHQITFISISAS
ncbi:hypothetical protein AVEN_181268-1 [Araneus ventricosus]|uniref:Uncharacterized protein n=1 Tax=Araneus ventricosus TaxID=182803 RepID=A0A4Y2XAF3_ARAVE|nr:hypothetical protein AVEN_32299-1 [Araneus ventricosus]GBO45964.1 hypothetical protein AVEN_181268-1 [Araneus ventricosus]